MRRTTVGVLGLFVSAGLAAAGGECGSFFDPVVVFSEIPGHPTAAAPGLGIDFTGFLSLNASPNGQHYVFKAFIDDAENDVIVVGDLSTGTASVVAREADPTPIAGTTHNFLDSDCGINDSGEYAYGSRLDGATSGTDELVFAGDGGGQWAAVREGDPAPGLNDPNGAGDELYGNSLNSVHVLADGTVAYKADLIQNIDRDFESALYHGMAVRAQEGDFIDFDIGGAAQVDGFVGLSGNTFSSSPDGSVWAVEADIDPSFSSQDAVVVSNLIVLEAGSTIPGTTQPIDAVFAVDVDDQGNWYARGDFADDTDWAVRNGELIAMTGMPITPGSSETWGDVISGVTGGGGSYAVTGTTSEADPDRDSVIVLNGEQVLAREGDEPFIAGLDVEIASFSPNDLSLGFGGSGTPIAFVTLRDSETGEALGDAMLHWFQVVSCSVADIAEPCGVLDLGDVQAFIAGFVNQEPVADIEPPFGVWDLSDVQSFITGFVNGCP